MFAQVAPPARVLAVLLLFAAACGGPEPGPATPAAAAVVEGGPCKTAESEEKCLVVEGAQQRMFCDPVSSTWQIGGFCDAGQLCAETPSPQGSPKRVALCVGGATADTSEPDAAGDSVADSGGEADVGPSPEDASAEVSDAKAEVVDAKTDVKVPVCGDGKCESPESPATCSKDCKAPASCGNSLCEADKLEDEENCPSDCAFAEEFNLCLQSACTSQFKSCNANTVCAAVVECAIDCGGTVACIDLCAVGTTEAAKPAVFSLLNCAWSNLCYPTACGDGACQAPKENGFSCGADCKAGGTACGDGKCQAPEGHATCPGDCTTAPATCGNGKCDAGEAAANCPQDCKAALCGNGVCETGEGPVNCPADCKAASCGNGVCDGSETPTSCGADCKTTGCGNKLCDSGETTATCPGDCGAGCQNLCGKQSKYGGKICFCDEMCATADPPDCCADKATYCKAACTPACTGKVCGANGCGGTCGPACATGKSCNAAGQCVATCAPKCAGKTCGPDGCGGQCGPACSANKTCNAAGVCVCVADCKGKTCGPDGCGGQCGPACASGKTCSSAGLCVGPFCGNGLCDGAETSAVCPQDCALGCKDKCGGQSKDASGKVCFCDGRCEKMVPPDCCADKKTFCP